MIARPLFALLLAALAAVAAPGPSSAAETATPPSRIVSVGGSVTEILAALGVADRIVAVDTTSSYPPEAVAGRTSVGYMRQLSAEGILALGADRIVAAEGAGPPAVLDLLSGAGLKVERIPDRPSLDGMAGKIRAIGALVGRTAEADRLVAALAADLDALAAERAKITRPVRVLFVIAVQNGRPTAAGRGTSADAMIRLAGAANAADGFEGYKPLSDEAAVAAAPEVVVTMHRPDLVPAEILALPALAGTPAARAGALVTMDGLYLLGFGPRTPAAARDLMRAVAEKAPRP